MSENTVPERNVVVFGAFAAGFESFTNFQFKNARPDFNAGPAV
jgi:hypothetical protein